MKQLNKLTSLLIVIMLLTMVASAWAQEESRLDQVMKRDKLIVATYSTSPPLCYKDKNGDLVGFEIDIARIIAAGLLGDSNKIEFLIIESAGRFPAVLSGKADFGIASTTIYPDRANRVAFTSPYMDSGTALFARKDLKAKTIKDINKKELTIGGKNNPQNAERAERYVPKMKTKWFDSDNILLLSVKSGSVDVAQTDIAIVQWYAANNKDLQVLPFSFSDMSNNAIFMKPGDFKWWLFLDTMVKELRTGSRYGEYRDAYNKWFGKNPPPQRFYTGNNN